MSFFVVYAASCNILKTLQGTHAEIVTSRRATEIIEAKSGDRQANPSFQAKIRIHPVSFRFLTSHIIFTVQTSSFH